MSGEQVTAHPDVGRRAEEVTQPGRPAFPRLNGGGGFGLSAATGSHGNFSSSFSESGSNQDPGLDIWFPFVRRGDLLRNPHVSTDPPPPKCVLTWIWKRPRPNYSLPEILLKGSTWANTWRVLGTGGRPTSSRPDPSHPRYPHMRPQRHRAFQLSASSLFRCICFCSFL